MADPPPPLRESSPQPNRPRLRTLSHRLSSASDGYFPPQSLKSTQSEATGRDIYAERVSFSIPRPRPSISSRASSTISLRRKESDASERHTEATSGTISELAVEEGQYQYEPPRFLGRRMSDTNKQSALPEPLRRPESVTRSATSHENKRMSTSSLYSLTSARAGGITNPTTTSTNGSLNGGEGVHRSASGAARPETGASPVTVTATSISEVGPTGTATSSHQLTAKDGNEIAVEKRAVPRQEGTSRANIPRSRSRAKRRFSGSTAGGSSHSPGSERGLMAAKEKEVPKPAPYGIIGVCALDIKARSKPSRNILNRLIQKGEFEVVVFGDKVILDEDIENWPVCDFLISFYSDGFPLDKAIAYVKARRPFCVNDVPMQQILWDRRICLRILDKINVPTPRRIEVNRDGGPRVMTQELARVLKETAGIVVQGPDDGDKLLHPQPRKVELADDGDTLIVDNLTLKKPFVEKPVSGEDHNICIYYPKSMGGGARKLFRKIGNKSSEHVEGLTIPRAITEEGSSYVYEQFMRVDNAEDVKAYTVGAGYCHAETRKSPVVDGLVRRNNHGKEIRFVTNLTEDEKGMAGRISEAFGQRVCGFDMLRANGKSYVIDVNGWSFVKDNESYYNKCAEIMRELFIEEKKKRQAKEAARAAEKADKVARLSENAVISAEQSETEERVAMPPPPKREPSVRDNHRSGLSSLLAKSPSISKISNHLHRDSHSKKDTPTTSEFIPASIPMTAAESLEKIIPPTPARHVSASVPASTSASTTTLQNLTECILSEEDKEPELPPPAPKHAWKLKGMVSVIRHADRTPKQKYKFAFHTKPFIELLKGHQEEVLLTGEAALDSVLDAVDVAIHQGIEDKHKLKTLRNVLVKKGGWPGTKVQIKPMFRKKKAENENKDSQKQTFGTIADIPVDLEKAVPGATSAMSDAEGGMSDAEGRALKRTDSLTGVTLSRITAAEESLVLDKLQLIVKWGGEPTHSARYQAQELGENMRNDLFLMNREVLDEVHVFSSSERRVTTSAQIFSASFLNKKELASDFITIRKDLLDDSNAAKDEMDKVKKKLKVLLRQGEEPPPQFAWPAGMPEPSIIQRQVVQLMIFHRKVMRHNYQKLYGGPTPATNSLSQVINPSSQTVENPGQPGATGSMAQATATSAIQSRWCCGEDKDLFKERWEKLFLEFCDPEKVDPSKISELYDTMKFDALHNRQFLEWVFTPRDGLLEEEYSAYAAEDSPSTTGTASSRSERPPSEVDVSKVDTNGSVAEKDEKDKKSVSRRLFRRRSGANGFSGGKSAEMDPSGTTQSSSSSSAQTPSAQENYFKLFEGSSQTKAKTDARLEKLRELYKLAKVLFDFICPQEYGISDAEKLEIGLLTSLPLLKEIVADLEEMQASDDAKSFIYFTKESHIYTLLNCILEGGIETKIARSAIPELDYLSQICFELYESETTPSPPPKPAVPAPPAGEHATLQSLEEGLELSVPANTSSPLPQSTEPEKAVEQTFAYSIRITISPGAHTYDPLDVQLDSKHCIGCAPRRSLTQHMDWREVIERLREKFGTVKLPKRFLAINLSESHSFRKREDEETRSESTVVAGSEATVKGDVAAIDATAVEGVNGEAEAEEPVRYRAPTLTVPEGTGNEWNKKDRTASVSSLLVDLDGQGGGLNRETLLELRAEGMAADIKEEDERVGRVATEEVKAAEKVANGEVEGPENRE